MAPLYEPAGSGGGFSTIDCPSGTDPVAGTTLTLTVDRYNTITGDSATDTVAFTKNLTATSVASSPYTVLSTDVYLFVSTASARTITMPVASTRRLIYIKDVTGSANTNPITLDPDGSDTIEGINANLTLSTDYGYWALLSDGTSAWWIVS